MKAQGIRIGDSLRKDVSNKSKNLDMMKPLFTRFRVGLRENILSVRRRFGDLQILFTMQTFVSFLAAAFFSWRLAEAFKGSLYDYWGMKLNAWTAFFFHPYESNFFNFIFLCATTSLYGLLIYCRFFDEKTKRFLKREREGRKSGLFAGIFIGSILVLVLAVSFSFFNQTGVFFFISLVPGAYFLFLNAKFDSGIGALGEMLFAIWRPEKKKNLIHQNYFVLLGLVLLLLSLEPLHMSNGTAPVYVANEYDLDSETILASGVISNKTFFSTLEDRPLESADVRNLPLPSETKFMIPSAPKIEMYTVLRNIGILIEGISEYRAKPDTIGMNWRQGYSDEIKSFIYKNFLEIFFINSSRGQINHIGHILNPINEFMLGKNLKNIYFQYGLGNTFIFKWLMEIFGGVSIDNYYKCYFLYLIYYSAFFIMAVLLFRDVEYVLACIAALAFSFFYQGYIAFVIAPGIIPSIRFFDVWVITMMLMYFKRDRLIYLLSAGIFSFLGILINQPFGLFLSASFIISFLAYVLENKKGRERSVWLLGVLFFTFIGLNLYFRAGTNPPGNLFIYYLTGLFSWGAHRIIVVMTIFYLLGSYLFIFMLKGNRHYFKYLYLMIFLYCQGLLLYYYWAGLSNHLPTVIPFIALQIFLMLYIMERHVWDKAFLVWKFIRYVKSVAIIILIAGILQYAAIFYKQKALFDDNFVNHRTYSWEFDRAGFLSTMNPALIGESIEMIRRYSPNHPGIYIISQYDNLLPFLAHRFSLMPFFQLSWYLLSEKEHNETIALIQNRKPKYLFVDSNIMVQEHLWETLCPKISVESSAKRGRYTEMRRIFLSCYGDYEKIEEGSILSVYRRKEFR